MSTLASSCACQGLCGSALWTCTIVCKTAIRTCVAFLGLGGAGGSTLPVVPVSRQGDKQVDQVLVEPTLA